MVLVVDKNSLGASNPQNASLKTTTPWRRKARAAAALRVSSVLRLQQLQGALLPATGDKHATAVCGR